MAKTKDVYRVTGRTSDEITRELNFLFARLADRMDRIEGIRGTASIASDLEMNANKVTNIAASTDEEDAARVGSVDDLSTEVDALPTVAEIAATAWTWTDDHEWSGTAPYLQLYETDGTANKRKYRITADGGVLTLTYRVDAGTIAGSGGLMRFNNAPTALVGENNLVEFGWSGAGTTRVHALAFTAGTSTSDPEFLLDNSFGMAAFAGLGVYAWAETYALQTNYIGMFHDGTNGTLQTTGQVILDGTAVRLGSSSGPLVDWGTGSPESAVTAPVGSLWSRTDGGTNTTLYVKESGTGNTGWVAYGAAGGGSDPWTYVVLESDFTISTTSNNNVTGLSFTPAADTRYHIEGYYLLSTATNTVGARPGIAWPTGYSDGASYTQAPNSKTALAMQNGNPVTGTANAASTGLPVANRSYAGQMQAILLMGGSPSGNFQITLASETAAVNVTMKAGSFIRYRTY